MPLFVWPRKSHPLTNIFSTSSNHHHHWLAIIITTTTYNHHLGLTTTTTTAITTITTRVDLSQPATLLAVAPGGAMMACGRGFAVRCDEMSNGSQPQTIATSLNGSVVGVGESQPSCISLVSVVNSARTHTTTQRAHCHTSSHHIESVP
jgi:hypothetical protein